MSVVDMVILILKLIVGIKQLQNSNNEFEDKYHHIHYAHTRLLLVKRSTMLAYLSAACCQHVLAETGGAVSALTL